MRLPRLRLSTTGAVVLAGALPAVALALWWIADAVALVGHKVPGLLPLALFLAVPAALGLAFASLLLWHSLASPRRDPPPADARMDAEIVSDDL